MLLFRSLCILVLAERVFLIKTLKWATSVNFFNILDLTVVLEHSASREVYLKKTIIFVECRVDQSLAVFWALGLGFSTGFL